MRLSKRNCIFCVCPFYVGEIETEKKQQNGKRQKTIKNSVFQRWSSKNEKNEKMDF